MRRLIAALLLLAPPVLAQEAPSDGVPDRRVAISRDVDFPGGDLGPVFDVTLDACQATCLADNACVAFTYNREAAACFPKSAPGASTPFAGAVSGLVLDTDPAVLAAAPARAATLGFLQPDDFERAETLGREIGREHSSDGYPADELLASAASREAAGDPLTAFRFTGAALALTDDPALWRDYARLALRVDPVDEATGAARAAALPAAVAAYLRSADPVSQAQSLLLLAQALESDGRGKESIGALRLAVSLDPSPPTQEALDRAISLYGFNVVETSIQNDSAEPRACVLFNDALRPGLDYAPFVQLPDDSLTVSAEDGQLCIEGLTHGQRLQATLREGLPSLSGETLARSIPLDLYVRDRAPSVRVLSRAYVLPRGGAATLPISTVNLTEVALRISRVSDRNLLRTLVDGNFSAPVYGWDEDWLERNIATPVWEGTVQVAPGALNADVVTDVPVADALAGQPAGVYALTAAVPGQNPYDRPATSQWFVLSDLGLATYQGTDGLTVVVRSLADASAVAGARVLLLSRANGELGTAVTDADGVARFAAGLVRGTGGEAPALVTVTTGDEETPSDLAFLSLLDPAFDLSDRGAEGRAPAGPLDAFLATDRGAYRAGETIHATALLRDDRARAVGGVPLTAVLTRPDGVEYARATSTEDAAGGHVFAFDIATNAPRGTWRLAVKADPQADEALAEETVLVEDFLPERIDLALSPPEVARADEAIPVEAQADWLFGAPAAGVTLEGEVTLAPAAELPDWPGYVWGLYDAPLDPQTESFGGEVTDAGGAARLLLPLPLVDAAASRPLEARIAVRAIEASGRPVERRVTVPVAATGPMIGLRLPGDVLPEGSTAGIALVAVGPDGASVPMSVNWTVNRLDTRYQWYELDGQWNWEPQTRRVRVATGTVTLDGGPATISVPVDWGRYEVVAEQVDGLAAASATFSAGWYAAEEAEASPDRLEVALDRAAYAPGDTATLRIAAEGPGTALVSVLSNRVVAMQAVAVGSGETVVRLPVTEDWGTGVYVAAQLLRPVEGRAPADARAPARSLGLAHAAVDPQDRSLEVALTAPEEIRPRGPLTVGIEVPGVTPGKPAYVTLAAVDLGLLNLTGFESPDPAAYYFGQQRLGVELRDLYGRLIEPGGGALGLLREGGDAMGTSLQSPPPTERLLAYFEGPVQVDAEGRAEVTFDIPAFNGTVRLMAIAWSEDGVGAASRDVLVRDPAVLVASLPRVLSPGDTSRLRLDLTETEGQGGDFRVEVAADGLTLSESTLEADLAPGGTWRRDLTLSAVSAGVHEVAVTVITPAGERLERTFPVAVAARDPVVARTYRFDLGPGQAFTFDDAVLAEFAPGTAEAALSVGPLARMNVGGLLESLDRMPYGCTEQLASGALPLLYLSEVAEALDLAPRADLDRRVNDAIQAILANQDSSGAFGLWGPASGDLWLDAYVTDFLSRARARGYAVPQPAFEAALANLTNQVAYYPDFETGGEDLAYALLVLAREGQALIGDLRYFADTKAQSFATPLAVAQVGAALAAYGDQPRADALFAQADRMLAAQPEDALQSVWRADYGTRRRDEAAVLTLALEAGSRAVDAKRLAAAVGTRVDQPASTQEAVWTLLAAAALTERADASGVTVDGQPLSGPTAWRMTAGADPVQVVNSGAGPVELTVTALGVPEAPEPAGGTGWAIDRAYYTLEGEPAQPDGVAAGTRLVAVLTITPMGFQAGRMMVNDPLPGGFEIENPDLLQSGAIATLPWLATVYAASTEARDDRFLAAVDWQSSDPFRVAYIVRAVTPGQYRHPAPSVEDMYRPALRAQGAPGEVNVTE